MKNVMNAKEIKHLRQQLGMTALQLAKELGVTENTVNRWETGWRECRGGAVKAMRLMLQESKRAISA